MADNEPQAKIWNKYRRDSLTEKDKLTYHVIDSLGKAENLDKTIHILEAIASERIPYKFLDFDIGKFVGFNEHEGWRFGLGVHNNLHLSDRFLAGGYVSYGLQDKVFKYGGDASVKFLDNYDVRLGFSYINDVSESGGIEFYEQHGLLSDAMYRNLMVTRMDKIVREQIFLKFTAFKYLKANITLSQINKIPTMGYYYGSTYGNVSVQFNNFYFTELGSYSVTVIRKNLSKQSTIKYRKDTKYPIVMFNYIRGFNNSLDLKYRSKHYTLLDGEFAYNRYELKIKKSFFIKDIGTTSLQFQGGYIDGNLPYCNLFNGIGSYEQFTIACPNSFETMRMNEFLSNRYAALFFTHSFGKLLFRFKKFSPEPAIVTNVCIGSLNNPDNHYNVVIHNLRKGYIESGLLINSILKTGLYGIGVGAFYRYGYYALPAYYNNFAYKVVLTFYI